MISNRKSTRPDAAPTDELESPAPQSRRRLRRYGAPVVGAAFALSMIGSGCAIKPSTIFKAQYDAGKASGQLPWVCKSEGSGTDMAGHVHAGDTPNPYAGIVKGSLSWEDCAVVTDFMDKAYASVMRFPTRGAAKKGGLFNQSVQFVPGLGTHDSVIPHTATGMDPSKPMFLQYDGEGDSAKLAGMSWFVMNNSNVPPAGLPGTNDMWHTHATLCYAAAGKVVGNEISDAECKARGGANQKLPGVWMLHAWIAPGFENKRDVFSGAFNCVKGTGPVAANDPCHDDLSDPEHPVATTTRPTPTITVPGATTTIPAVTTTTMDMSHGNHGH